MRLWPDGSPIRVHADEAERPLAFTWHGVTHRVTSIEDVREPRLDWWSVTGEVHRVYYLVITNQDLIVEIFRDVPTGAWFVSRQFD